MMSIGRYAYGDLMQQTSKRCG